MALTAIVTNAGRAALVNAANTGTAPVTIAQVGLTATAVAPGVGITALPGEYKRVATISGDVVADDMIHLIVRDESADVFTVRSFALYLGDGTLFAIYGQAEVILEKSAQAMMLLAIDVQFADVAAAMLTFGDANFLNPPATTEQIGVVELSTLAETLAGSDPARVPSAKMVKDAVYAWLDARFGVNNAGIWHPGNDGAGSGLDADLLDGLDSSVFARRDGSANTARDGGVVVAGAIPSDNVWAGGLQLREVNYVAGGQTSSPYAPALTFHWSGVVASSIKMTSDGHFRFRDQSVSPGGYRHIYAANLYSNGNIVWNSGNDGAGSGLDADMLDGQDGSYYTNIAARLGYMPVNRAGDTFSGDVTAPRILLTANGDGQAIKVGDDAWIGDVNIPNGVRVTGVQNVDRGYICFGNSDLTSLGRIGTGPLTYGGQTVWHGGNDGSGSGLDADLLDGRDGSYYTNIAAHLGYSPVNRAGDTMAGTLVIPTAESQSIAARPSSSTMLEVRGNGTGAAVLTFHRPGSHAAFLGLDTDNKLKLGGWSLGANAYEIWHSGNDGSGSGLDADMLDGQDGSYYTNIVARLGYMPVNRAGDTFSGDVTAPRILLAASGDGKAIKVGDDAWLGDVNITNGFRVTGVQNADRGYICFGNADVAALGRIGAGPLTYNSYTLWHAGNDGSGSGLDADLLDGQDSNFYTNIPARLGFVPANKAGDTFTGSIKRDENFYIDFAGDNPLINFDANDYFVFDRAANTLSLNLGSQTRMLWRGSGNFEILAAGGVYFNSLPVWHSGNDGSGSGLDADLLDGFQASDLAKMADFANNLSAAGYQKLAGGLILQWCTTATQQNVETTATATFPMQFPNAVLDVQLTTRVDIPSVEADTWYQLVGDPTLSGCTVMRARSDNDSDRPTYCRVFAIGR